MFEFRFSSNFKKRKIRRIFDLEPQEILLDKLAQKKTEKLGVFQVPLSKNILQLTYFLFLILFFILFYNTFQLQIIQGEEFSVLAERNKFIIYQIKATRGIIYDQKMEQLVFNKPSFDLFCYKNDLPQKESEKISVLKEIAEILNQDFEELKEKIEKSNQTQFLISENLTHQELIILETKAKELPGFQVERNSIREYLDGDVFANLIGYLGKIKSSELQQELEFYSINDYVGRDSLELYYEDILRKNAGKLQIEKDVFGNIISREITQFPKPGKSLVLWIDADLQRKITNQLQEKLKEIGAQKAVGIALNPKTGGVLALVSLPSFDNNLFQKGADSEALKNLLEDPFELEPLFNRAIAGIGYPTGSVIKPFIASAALEEEIISPEKNINCQGEIVIENPWYDAEDPESGQEKWIYHDWTIHGWTDLKKAIAQSCNVYFYRVGGGYKEQKGLGAERIEDYLQLFGWGEKTGIDLIGEGKGTLPTINSEWRLGDTYHLSIGQGAFAVTPIQVANAFAAIANNGSLYYPQIVQKIIDTSEGFTKIVEEVEPKLIRENFINSENLEIVKQGMRQAVTNGSATGWLDFLPVEVAAKTGTAQTERTNYYHNWIVSFAPYEEPEIVLLIAILDVKEIRAAALPVARDILQWYFTQE